MADKNVHEELAGIAKMLGEIRDREVAAEIAELRAEVEKLRAERGTHHCHGCSCVQPHHCNWGHCGCWITHSSVYPLTFTTTLPPVPTVTYPQTWTSGTGTGSGYVSSTGAISLTN